MFGSGGTAGGNGTYKKELGFPVPNYIERGGNYYSPQLESGYERGSKQDMASPFDWMHYALDIHFGLATFLSNFGAIPVYATMDGIAKNHGKGTVTIEGADVMTLYAHMETGGTYGIQVKNGQKVTAGDLIGFIGSTGTSDRFGNPTPHLHYEILVREKGYISQVFAIEGWRNVNPLTYTRIAENNAPGNLPLQSYQMELKNPAYMGLLTQQQRGIISRSETNQGIRLFFRFWADNWKTPPNK